MSGWQDAPVVSSRAQASAPAPAWSNAPVVQQAASGGLLHDLGLGVRDVAEGATGAVTGLHDTDAAFDNWVRRGLNRLSGTNLWKPYPLWQPAFNQALTAAGLPRAKTPNERLVGSIIKGASGALTGAGVLGALSDGASAITSIPNLIRATLAGASGGGAQAIARQAGAGPALQFATGLVGAAVPGALEGTATTIPALWRPFLRSGQRQLAANVLADNATNAPAAASVLEQARPIVPGSLRTAGEASADPGLLNLEKGVRAINPKVFAERVSQQNAARQAELAKLGGTPADIERAQAFRDEQTDPMREGAFAAARGLPMTLFRGDRPGATPGFWNGGALWTTPERAIAEDYAAHQLGPEDFKPGHIDQSAPGSVSTHDVVLRKPFHLTRENVGDFKQFYDPEEADTGGYFDIDENDGLHGISPSARDNLLKQGYDSVIVHNEATRPDGEPASVILLKSPEELARPTVRRPSNVLGPDGAPIETEELGDGATQVDTAPVQRTVKGILDSPSGAREAVSKTMGWVRKLIGENTDPETLYEVRKDLELAQRGKLQPTGRDAPNASMLAQTRGELGRVINSLDAAIEKAAPGYRDYLARYRELSEPINQREAIQALERKASSGLDTATGEPFLMPGQFARHLASALDRESSSSNPLRFTADQRARLGALREDLQRANALSSPTVRAPGSDTFQNFMRGNRLAGLAFRTSRFLPGVGRIARGLGESVDRRVNEQLAEAMLDPAEGAQLLRRGVKTLPFATQVKRLLERRAIPAALGQRAALPAPTSTSLGPLVLPAPASLAPLVRNAHARHAHEHHEPERKAHQWAALVLSGREPALLVHHGLNKFTTIYPPSYPSGVAQLLDGALPPR